MSHKLKVHMFDKDGHTKCRRNILSAQSFNVNTQTFACVSRSQVILVKEGYEGVTCHWCRWGRPGKQR